MEKTIKIGDETILHAPSCNVELSTSACDELEYSCWDLFLEYISTMGIKAENEFKDDDTDIHDAIDFAIAKEIQEAVLSILDKHLHINYTDE